MTGVQTCALPISNQVLMVEMHNHKLSLTICDYEQLVSIGYKYNQFEIDDVS